MKKILKKIPVTDKELAILANLSKRVLWSSPEIRKRLQIEHKINITPANFYSNIPLVEDIESSFEYRGLDNEPVYGMLFEQESMEDFAQSLIEYADEFEPPSEGSKDAPEEYFWKNPAFSFLDAMSYYCMIRKYKPKILLEIGSGFSTLVASQAMQKNGFGEIKVIEPYPMSFLHDLPHVTSIVEKFVQDIPLKEVVEMVEQSELWFIDSTHTVKIGSDCLYIYLKVMPEIQSATLVHSHDIYLPYGMPKKGALETHIYWTEQYLLYAFLLQNPGSKVLFGSTYCTLNLKETATRIMNQKYRIGGASLWYTLNNFS